MKISNSIYFFLILTATFISAAKAENSEETTSDLCYYSEDEAILEQYKFRVNGSRSFVVKPGAYKDYYSVGTSIYFENGLEAITWKKEYYHKESAESHRDLMNWRYSEKGSHPPGTEVFLKIAPSHAEGYFELKPIHEYVDICRSTNEDNNYFTMLPKISKCDFIETIEVKEGWLWNNEVITYHFEVELTDGSKWMRYFGNKKPKCSWGEGDRIIVSVAPKEIILINIDQDTERYYVRNWIGSFKFMGLTP